MVEPDKGAACEDLRNVCVEPLVRRGLAVSVSSKSDESERRAGGTKTKERGNIAGSSGSAVMSVCEAHGKRNGCTHQSPPESGRAGFALFPAAAEAKEAGAIGKVLR